MGYILKSGGYIDFYISKKKYESLKTERGQMNYVYRVLKQFLKNMTGLITKEGLEVRDVDITSNNFWGDKISIIEAQYSKLKANENKLIVRNFMIDLIAVVLTKECENQFPEFKFEHFILKIGHSKLI